jgi:hypothetical protein
MSPINRLSRKPMNPRKASWSSQDFARERELDRIVSATDFLDLTIDSMPDDIEEKMLLDFELNDITDSTRNRELFLESQQIRQLLARQKIVPERVAPTRDGRGYVRLTFNDVFKLLFNNDEEA